MEPIFWSLMVVWLFVRYVVGDLIAAATGREAPRSTQRRTRQQLQQERASAGLPPTVGQAVSGRLANRILNPPPRRPAKPRGPLGDFLANFLRDVLDEATKRRQERWRASHEPRPQRPDRPRDEHNPDDVIDADIVDDDAPTKGDPDTPDPAPVTPLRPPAPAGDQPAPSSTNPSSDTPGGSPVDTPNGETADPTAAIDFADGCIAVLTDLITQTELSITTLTEKGVTGQSVEEFEGMKEQFSLALSRAQTAKGVFEEHKAKQDELGSGDLAGTQKDGYLDGAAA